MPSRSKDLLICDCI